MKKLIITSNTHSSSLSQEPQLIAPNSPDEYLGLPGDNLNLYAVMNLFQRSQTLEGFSKNSE